MIRANNGFVVIKFLADKEQRSPGGLTLARQNNHIGVAEVVDSSEVKYKKGNRVLVYRQLSTLIHDGMEVAFIKAEDILGEVVDDVAK